MYLPNRSITHTHIHPQPVCRAARPHTHTHARTHETEVGTEGQTHPPDSVSATTHGTCAVSRASQSVKHRSTGRHTLYVCMCVCMYVVPADSQPWVSPCTHTMDAQADQTHTDGRTKDGCIPLPYIILQPTHYIAHTTLSTHTNAQRTDTHATHTSPTAAAAPDEHFSIGRSVRQSVSQPMHTAYSHTGAQACMHITERIHAT